MLTGVDLRLFKCFEVLQLPLTPLTLLTGQNSSGKSSVLQALVLLHQTMREHEWATRLALNGSSIRMGTVSNVVDGLQGTNEFSIAVQDEDAAFDWTFVGERHEMSMLVERIAIGGQQSNQPRELRFLLPLNAPELVDPLVERLRRLSYITAERIAPQPAYFLEDPGTVRVVGPRGEHAVSVLHWGRDDPVMDALVLEGPPPTRLWQVQARMEKLFPGFALSLDYAPQVQAVSLGLRTSDATNFHSPIHTGFGLTQVLPIVIAALSAQKGDLLLIENPEIHLHPAGQALIGQFLADVAGAGIQVLVETHSDHVLNGVRRAVKSERISSDSVSIHFFRSRSDNEPQVLSPSVDDSGNIDQWPEGFFDQFDKDMDFFAGWTEN